MELNMCYLIRGSISYFLGGLREKKFKSQEFMFQNAGHSSLSFLLLFFQRVNWQTNYVKEFRKGARKLVLHE